MKQFFAVIHLMILLLVGLNIDIQTQEKKEIKNQIASQTASVNDFYFICYYDYFNYAENTETSHQFAKRILTSYKKFPFDEHLKEKIAELLRTKEISKYIFIAKYQIIRFEGPDIIHPFNYFW